MSRKGLTLAIKAAGGVTMLAEKLRITSQAVSQWDKVPAHRIVQVEKITGIDRALLRPDLYRRED